MKILLAGFGDIAQRLVPIFQKENHKIVGARRSKLEYSNVSTFSVDFTELSQLKKLDVDFDVIVVSLSPKSYTELDYKKTYVESLGNIISYFSITNAKLYKRPYIIFISSTSVYGQSNAEIINEASIAESKQFNGKILLQAEKLLQNSYLDHVIIRLSGIYGRNNNARIVNKFKPENHNDLLTELYKKGNNWTNRVHIDDCVNLIAFIVKEKIRGNKILPLYIISDNFPTLQIDLYEYIAKQIGNDCLAKIDFDKIRRDINRGQTGKRCDNSLIKQSGYSFIYSSYVDGYKI